MVKKRVSKVEQMEAERLVTRWNAAHPVGCRVVLTTDDGGLIETTTRHPASLIAGYIPVVWVHGLTGCYRLDRCEAVS